MSRIRIIATPAGEAPEWVRQAWVGLEIPVEDCAGMGEVHGVLSGKPDPSNSDGYHVNEKSAVDILRAKSFGAARWWEEHIDIQPHKHLVFGKEFCQLIP